MHRSVTELTDQQKVVLALQDIATGRFADQSMGVCYALSRKLRHYNFGDAQEPYDIVFNATNNGYLNFMLLDRDIPGPRWNGVKGEIRRMFCGMLASRIERDGLDAVNYTPEDAAL